MPAIKFIFKYLNAQQPDMINQVIESESRSLRCSQTNKIKISENIKKGNFFHSIVNEWNITSDNIGEAGIVSTKKTYQKKVKTIFQVAKKENVIFVKKIQISTIKPTLKNNSLKPPYFSTFLFPYHPFLSLLPLTLFIFHFSLFN